LKLHGKDVTEGAREKLEAALGIVDGTEPVRVVFPFFLITMHKQP